MPNAKSVIQKIKKQFIDCAFPIFCAICGSEGAVLCPACEPDFPLKIFGFCPHCGKETPGGRVCARTLTDVALDGALAFSSYAHPLARRAIGEWKYDLVKEWGPALCRVFARGLSQITTLLPGRERITLVSVPITRRRFIFRGFNQAEQLAEAAQGILGCEIRKDILTRVRSRSPQAKIESDEARRINIEGAFALRKDARISGSVVLIDDVFTTGATLNECARVLKAAGARDVWGVTLARG